MQTKKTNEIRQDAMAAGLQKQAYRSPKLLTYGSVRQFTQGSKVTKTDANGTQTLQSDRAFKTNWSRIGSHPLGIGLYLFDYKTEFQDWAGHGRRFGVMADEVEVVMPEAVVMHADGYKRVNYAMLGIDLSGRAVH